MVQAHFGLFGHLRYQQSNWDQSENSSKKKPLCVLSTKEDEHTPKHSPSQHEPACSHKPIFSFRKPTRAELHTWLDMYTRRTQHTASATWGADQCLIFFPRCSSTTWAEPNRMASLAYHLHKQSKGICLLRGSYHVSFWGRGRWLGLVILYN